MPKLIKVSDAAWAELKRRAGEEGRTMVVIVDRLLAVSGAEPPVVRAAIRRAKAELPAVDRSSPKSTDIVCPKCGHGPAVHRAGAQGTRCEVCRTCVWAEVPA